VEQPGVLGGGNMTANFSIFDTEIRFNLWVIDPLEKSVVRFIKEGFGLWHAFDM
jgi:hypothetical protein